MESKLEEYKEKVDKGIEEELVNDVKAKQLLKCQMRQALHNFTEIELSAEHERLLSKGKGFVPAVSDTPENAARTVMKELDHFLVKYSERFGIKLPDRGRFSNVKDYLQEICALDSIGEEHRQFFGQLAARVKDAVLPVRNFFYYLLL